MAVREIEKGTEWHVRRQTSNVLTNHDDRIVVLESGGPGQAQIQFQDEGGNLGAPGAVDTIDFVGTSVAATLLGSVLTVTVSGGGGGAIRPQAVFDGNPDAILVNSKVRATVTASCTITGWTIIGDQTGSVVIDIFKATYAGYPTLASITGTAKPTMTAATKATSTTLTGWTTALAAGDVLEFNVDSITTCKQVYIVLDVS